MLKKRVALIVTVVMLTVALVGCSELPDTGKSATTVFATIFTCPDAKIVEIIPASVVSDGYVTPSDEIDAQNKIYEEKITELYGEYFSTQGLKLFLGSAYSYYYHLACSQKSYIVI